MRQSSKQQILTIPITKEFSRQYNVSYKVAHGALVPLYFINNQYKNYKLINITYSLISLTELYKFGMILQKIVLKSKENIVFVDSGDLSHRLSNDSPYGFSYNGKIFDERIMNYLKNNNFKSIVNFDLKLAKKAGECGLRSLVIMCGFLDGYRTNTQVLSYEKPFGIGYCTSKVDILEKDKKMKIYEQLTKIKENEIKQIRDNEDQFVKLARKSLENYIKYKKIIEVPDMLSNELLQERAGVFVSIKKDENLRGCIGTIQPTKNNVAEEIINNSISAGTKDPRFIEVEENELNKLVYSVDILKESEKVNSINELDVKKYGIIVSKGLRKGVLLPNLDGVETPLQQIKIALRKARIDENENYIIKRFAVERHC